MRAILIDAYGKDIREVTYNGDYKDIYRLLSDPAHPVDTFDAIRIDDTEAIFVDDEGLLKAEDNPGTVRFWKWKGGYQWYAGNGLVLGSDREGDSAGTQLTLDFVRDHVIFP